MVSSQTTIEAIDPNGASLGQILGLGNYAASWSPDCSQLAFISTRSDGARIYVASLNDLTHPKVDASSVTPEQGLRWSPDGTKIAYWTRRNGGTGDVYIVDVATMSETRLTSSDGHDQHPSWSPDGNTIVYIVGEANLYTMPFSGDANRLQVPNGTQAVDVAWWR